MLTADLRKMAQAVYIATNEEVAADIAVKMRAAADEIERLQALVNADTPQLSFEEKRDQVAEYNEEALLADTYEDALVGVVLHAGETLAAYDYAECVQILMTRDKMKRGEAVDFMNYNTVTAYKGVHSPAFLLRF